MIEKSTKCSFCFKEIKSSEIKSSFTRQEKLKEKNKETTTEAELNRLKKIKEMKNLSNLLFEKKLGFNSNSLSNSVNENEINKNLKEKDTIYQSNYKDKIQNTSDYQLSSIKKDIKVNKEREPESELNLHENINLNLKRLVDFLQIKKNQSVGALSYSLPVPTISNRSIDVSILIILRMKLKDLRLRL